MIFNIVGWIGGFLLAFCGLPQAIKAIKEKHAYGLSWMFLLSWFFGEILVLIFVVAQNLKWPINQAVINNLQWPLIFNYSFNIFVVSIILKYKISPKRTPQWMQTN
ncbi:MAG: PQ-loop repeat-containing protein [Candidatus Peribacteraceae bacterium]|nr:PQ-loop repeat-containing protein [Candidatus Peribacteraceae bacterium]